MPKKTITQKSDISKWFRGRIKGFEELGETEAIFEYESIKLRERQRKQAKKLSIKGYKAPQIPRPTILTTGDIEVLRNITIEEVKLSVTQGVPAVSKASRIYVAETPEWKREHLSDYTSHDYFDDREREEQARLDQIFNSYPSYYDEDDYYEPEPEPIDSPDNYWIDPTTGEAIEKSDISSLLERGREFIERLIEYTENEASTAVQSQSSYRSGRLKSAKSRSWLEDNINKEKEQILNQLNSIKNNEENLKNFTIVASKGDYLQQVQDAIGERIHQAYKTAGNNSFNSSQLYNLLSTEPMTLEEALAYGDMLLEDGEDYL